MKRIVIIVLSIVWLCKLHSQNWVNVIDSMPNSHPFVLLAEKDTVNNILYIGGQFQQINNINTKGIVKYDGVKFDSLGAGFDPQWKGLFTASQPRAMKMFQNKLYVTGAAWNGTRWYGYGKGIEDVGTIHSISKVNGEIYITGVFDSINELSTGQGNFNFYTNIAKYDPIGDRWCTFMEPIGGGVAFSIEYNDSLYFGGSYLSIGNNTPAMPMTKWVGGSTSINCGAPVGVGINEYDKIRFSVYPVPATDFLNLIDDDGTLNNAQIEIQNTLGATVFSGDFTDKIDVSNLTAGIYFLTVKDNNRKKTIKFVKD